MSVYNTSAFNGDFRLTGGLIFRMIGSFCNQTREAVAEALDTFNAKRFVTGQVMPLNQFETETQSYMDSMISSTKSTFRRSLQLGREMVQDNALFPSVVTNFQIKYTIYNRSIGSIETQYTSIASNSSNCSCQYTTSCAFPAKIYTGRRVSSTPIERFTLPGIVSACYIVESVLQSNLVCFYNQSCIDQLIVVLNSPVVINTTVLDQTILSQYKPNSTIGDIIDRLMVEEWIKNSSHKEYYAQCNPTTCIATYDDNNDFIVVFSTIIGLVGVLPAILRTVVPWVVKKLRPCCKKHHRVHIEATMSDTTQI